MVAGRAARFDQLAPRRKRVIAFGAAAAAEVAVHTAAARRWKSPDLGTPYDSIASVASATTDIQSTC